MIDLSLTPANLLIAFTAYLIGTASPGPSNLVIMGMAMNAGRAPALVLASGVLTGSLFWGVLAALGLSTIFAAYSGALIAMKIAGGLYLLFLAAKSARAALSDHPPIAPGPATNDTYRRLFLRGAAMHLTNPKAIFVWLSIVTLALPVNTKSGDALVMVMGCAVIGTIVFGGYAIVFSTHTARRIYRALRRWFDGALALAFGYAGMHMLLSKTSTV